MKAKGLIFAAIVYLFLHWLLVFIQHEILWPFRCVIAPSGPSVLILSPIHGIRVLFAWYFGYWSLVVMMPTAITILFFVAYTEGFQSIDPWILAISAVYMLSAIVAFKLLELCLGPRGNPKRVEWRMIMLAGLVSGIMNVMAHGLYSPPDLDAHAAFVWLGLWLFSYVSGLFVILLMLLISLRMLGAVLYRNSND